MRDLTARARLLNPPDAPTEGAAAEVAAGTRVPEGGHREITLYA